MVVLLLLLLLNLLLLLVLLMVMVWEKGMVPVGRMCMMRVMRMMHVLVVVDVEQGLVVGGDEAGGVDACSRRQIRQRTC